MNAIKNSKLDSLIFLSKLFLTSLDRSVENFAKGVRSHWQIEKKLHWCLDVAFNEDGSRISQEHSSENIA